MNEISFKCPSCGCRLGHLGPSSGARLLLVTCANVSCRIEWEWEPDTDSYTELTVHSLEEARLKFVPWQPMITLVKANKKRKKTDWPWLFMALSDFFDWASLGVVLFMLFLLALSLQLLNSIFGG